MSKKNRSFLLQSVVSKNGSWNSDFNHNPKQHDGQFFASDRALKYSVRNMMEQMGKEVLIKKWIKDIKPGKKESSASVMEVMTSKELKEYLKKTYKKDFAEMFWQFEDVRQFGMVYDGLGVHGVVQISQGLDLYGQGSVYADDLTGRMNFESKSDSSKETRGMASRDFLTEAHFVYDITINPKNVEYLTKVPGFEDCVYTQEDYETLLECLENGPRNVKSTQKTNCYTGLLLQIDLIEEDKTLLSDLQNKLTLLPEKVEGKVVYDFTVLFDYLKQKEEKAGKQLFEKIVLKYEENDIQLQGAPESFSYLTDKEFQIEAL